jgi:hypothetical protein
MCGILQQGAVMGGWPVQREPMEWLATEFAARIRNGERPSIAEYVAQYPAYAHQIEELLPAVALLEQLRNDQPASEHLPIRSIH